MDWPANERVERRRWQPGEQVRLLTRFAPVVKDPRRFELLWGWSCRFQAQPNRPGHYALLLWCDRVAALGVLPVASGTLEARLRYVAGRLPGEAAFDAALESELAPCRCSWVCEFEGTASVAAAVSFVSACVTYRHAALIDAGTGWSHGRCRQWRRAMTRNQNRRTTRQVQQQPRPGIEDQRRTNPARQATRTEPSHQKDVHDQRMLDREEGAGEPKDDGDSSH